MLCLNFGSLPPSCGNGATMKHRCRFPGCTEHLHHSKSLCVTHWLKLPLADRKRLSDIYFRNGCRTTEPRYRRALAEAIATIAGG